MALRELELIDRVRSIMGRLGVLTLVVLSLISSEAWGEELPRFQLMGPDGQNYVSSVPGVLGGNRALGIVGRLDCRSALSWLRKGKYKRNRVFFESARVAMEAGYRPCGVCLPKAHEVWKAGGNWLQFLEISGFK